MNWFLGAINDSKIEKNFLSRCLDRYYSICTEGKEKNHMQGEFSCSSIESSICGKRENLYVSDDLIILVMLA